MRKVEVGGYLKEFYEAPEMEIIVFDADVITENSSQTPPPTPD